MQPATYNDDFMKKFINKNINLDSLIDLVRDRPIIWDSSADGYRNKDCSANAWEDVCKHLYNGYEKLPEEIKKLVVKVVKQKWTTARDIWQRNHKKRKEAAQMGENISELKDSHRYEKLKFLSKLYDKYDNLKPNNSDEKMDCIDLDELDSPLSPDQMDPDADTVDYNNMKIQQNVSWFFKTKDAFNQTPQKRKPEKSDVGTLNEQGMSLPKTRIINVEDINKVSGEIMASKRRISTNGHSEVDKVGKTSSSVHPKAMNCQKEIITSSPSTHSVNKPVSNETKKHDFAESSRNNTSKPEVPIIKDEDSSHPKDSDNMTSPAVSDIKESSVEPKVEAASVENNQIEPFLQLLHLSIQDFDKSKIQQFLFEILKPLTAGLNKKELLNFQIEALQLVRKIEGSNSSLE